jgi:hypothetical protein
MAEFRIKQGDIDPVIVVTLLDHEDLPFDTTGCTAAELRVRAIGKRAHVVGAMEFLEPAADGKVRYAWVAGDTDLVGSHEAVIVVTNANARQQTFPTDGFFTITVLDNIEADTAYTVPEVEMPPTTPVTYGTGYWPWTPTIYDGGTPHSGASVSVITALGVTLGPATTDANGQCLASDGFGAFRLAPGEYTVSVTDAGVTYTQKLTIDADGNGDVW